MDEREIMEKQLNSISYWLNQLTSEVKGLKEELNHLNYRMKKQTISQGEV